jgi:hypothetical protein
MDYNNAGVWFTEAEAGYTLVGLRFRHAVANDPGAAQFMNTVGELAHAAATGAVSVEPQWGCRRRCDPRPRSRVRAGLPRAPLLRHERAAQAVRLAPAWRRRVLR